jgi:hypothetical protein
MPTLSPQEMRKETSYNFFACWLSLSTNPARRLSRSERVQYMTTNHTERVARSRRNLICRSNRVTSRHAPSSAPVNILPSPSFATLRFPTPQLLQLYHQHCIRANRPQVPTCLLTLCTTCRNVPLTPAKHNPPHPGDHDSSPTNPRITRRSR